MTRVSRFVVPVFVVLWILVLAGPAQADPAPADQHSQNLKLLASLPRTGTTNSDLAFWGQLAYQGNYNGFRVLDISDPNHPSVLADVDCGSGQGDVTV